MELTGLDHIVLCVRDVERTIRFYEDLLGMEAREERPGKWSLHFGDQKISLQDAASVPEIAKGTTPGSGNFCVLTRDSIDAFAATLDARDIERLAGPDERIGATGRIRSVYFHDPDGNLVEVARSIEGERG